MNSQPSTHHPQHPAIPPGYKQTEVGVIPEEWEVKPLAAIADKIMVGIASAATHAYRVKGVPMFRNQNIKAGYLDDRDLLFIAPDYEVAFKNKRLRAGDLLTMRTGYPGVTAIVPPRYDSAQSFTTLITRPRQHEAESPYLCHFINSEIGQQFFIQSQIGGAQKNVNAGTLREMPVPLPKRPEQRAIATALSDVDALLTALDRLIAKKRDIKQATMQQLLTGQTRLPGFHGEWEVNTVAELEKQKLVQLSRGQVISKKDIDNTPGDFPIYSSSIHNDGLFGRYGVFLFDEEMITWSVDGGGNFFHRRKHKFSVTNVCGFMRVDTSRIDCRFFAAELQLLHSRKTFDYQSKAHPSVVRKEYEVKLPPLPEQSAIAAVLTDMDAELAALEQRRDRTRALKQAMMQELLTGKTRLLSTGGNDV